MMYRFAGSLLLVAAFLLAVPYHSLQAQDTELLERFDYDGSVFGRGIYIQRDLPLPSPPVDEDEGRRTEQGYYEYFLCETLPETCNRSDNKESQDFYSIRFRLNLAFRPSSYVDILYGLEVGDITFGRDETDNSGPGTGGRGSGRTNLETRQLILKFHNKADTTSAEVGVFPFSTPSGVVTATSGAGVRLQHEVEAIDSGFEAIYIRSIDNSRIDDDSNGFSDENYSDINQGVLRWKWSTFRDFQTELYGVYRNDNDPSTEDPTDSSEETSRMYWGGLYVTIKIGAGELMLHGVGNWGRFERPLSEDPKLSAIAANDDDPLQSYFTEALQPPLREEYRVNAGAGEASFKYPVSDRVEVSVLYAGGSGRLPGDTEPDGSDVDYRPDQFRTAGQAYQFSELGVDSSGGYSVFSLGRLTGVQAVGARVKMRLLDSLVGRIDYYRLDAYRTPNIDANSTYTRYLRQNDPDKFLGEEWNLRFDYTVFSDLNFQAKLGWFNAATGYKVWQDVEYGDDLYEVQASVTQTF